MSAPDRDSSDGRETSDEEREISVRITMDLQTHHRLRVTAAKANKSMAAFLRDLIQSNVLPV